MQIGTTTIPFLPLAAVVLAMLLVVLVLWGVRRARRHPAPAAVPGARPAVRAPEPEHQPCAADWTGEVANGYVPAPPPVERPRTVADVVAERRADTAPLPVVPPEAAAPGVQGGTAAPADDPAPDAVEPARDDPGTHGTTAPAPEGDTASGDVLSAPSDERPDPATLAAVRTPEDAADPDPVADEVPPVAGPLSPDAQDPVPPPWSAARSEHADSGLEPVDAEPGAAGGGPAGTASRGAEGSEPVSRAVQQALAARAVQRARLRHDDVADEGRPGSAPETGEGPVPGREHPLTVVPSAQVGSADARDRLLSVLLTDPARAVGATEDLDDARARIDQLGDVLRRRRDELAVAVRHLHESGLDREQIGRLAGMGGDDVASILEARTGDEGNRHA